MSSHKINTEQNLKKKNNIDATSQRDYASVLRLKKRRRRTVDGCGGGWYGGEREVYVCVCVCKKSTAATFVLCSPLSGG